MSHPTALRLDRPVVNTPGQPASAGAKRDACVPNLSPAEARKRLAGGVVGLAVSLAVLALLIGLGADRWWRLALLPLYWGAASGFFQWRDKT